MRSESPGYMTAEESSFRVQTPNSLPRKILVVALDPASGGLGDHLAEERWSNIRFANFAVSRADENSAFNGLSAIEENTCDVVIVVGTVGRDLSQARRLAARWMESSIEVSAILIAPKRASPTEVRDALLSLRPVSRTLAVIRDGELVRGILQALGR